MVFYYSDIKLDEMEIMFTNEKKNLHWWMDDLFISRVFTLLIYLKLLRPQVH